MWSLVKWSAVAVLWALLVGCQGSPSSQDEDPIDGDECAAGTHNCTEGYECEDTPDGFLCNDIDECALGDFDCEDGYVCVNVAGGYECSDEDECAAGTHGCDELAGLCVNVEGGFECDCIEGWYLAEDGTTCIFALETGSALATAQSGPWSSPSTWDEDRVPEDGDWITIGHAVTVAAGETVAAGHSPPASDDNAAILILPTGSLTLGAGSTLISRGDLKTAGDVTLAAGATLQLDGSRALDRYTAVYLLEITPGTTTAHLQVNGTAGQRSTVRSNELAAHARITDGGVVGGGRIVAEHCDFVGLGGYPDYHGWSYLPAGNGEPYRIRDCTFDGCSQVSSPVDRIPAAGNVEFTRVRWTNSVVKPVEERELYEEWGIFHTGAQPGATVKVDHCEFDEMPALFFYDDYQIENNVFRRGVIGFSQLGGEWSSFRHNFVRWDSDDVARWGLPGGTVLEDSLFIVDPSGCGVPNEPAICWNPHFIHMEADGGSEIIGNIWWWTGIDEAGEGDGIIMTGATEGTRADNWYMFDRNIYLPNGNGPDGAYNGSTTPFTILDSTDNFQVIFQRNTVFSGNSYGGCIIGESGVTYAHDIGYFKSNLFVGSSGFTGYKIFNFGEAEDDAVLAGDADYNASYRINDGTDYGAGAGKGYFELSFTEPGLVGANDLDDVNPDFVDSGRNPATWDESLGGAGTLDSAMDRLSPGGGSTMEELIDYIREGFRPRNATLRGAGDPGGSPPSPDIGAVNLLP